MWLSLKSYRRNVNCFKHPRARFPFHTRPQGLIQACKTIIVETRKFRRRVERWKKKRNERKKYKFFFFETCTRNIVHLKNDFKMRTKRKLLHRAIRAVVVLRLYFTRNRHLSRLFNRVFRKHDENGVSTSRVENARSGVFSVVSSRKFPKKYDPNMNQNTIRCSWIEMTRILRL